jgi:hypothetical protein
MKRSERRAAPSRCAIPSGAEAAQQLPCGHLLAAEGRRRAACKAGAYAPGEGLA